MKEALYYIRKSNGKIQCVLCPHYCLLNEGETGLCLSRKNIKGKLWSLVYGEHCAVHLDPIEKKPLYHFYPGIEILSIGTTGCNFKCSFCQNADISQAPAEKYSFFRKFTPEQIVMMAGQQPNNIGIAYTYNEPLINFEFVFDTARLAKSNQLKNCLVSNGYINSGPLKALIPFIDAFNIDLKAFTNSFYQNLCKGSLSPVLKTIKLIRESGKHLELTFLAIPHKNTDQEKFKEMINWISDELGENTVLHLSRYFPRFRMKEPATSQRDLNQLFQIATNQLKFVYLGNTAKDDRQNTICPKCRRVLVARNGYSTRVLALKADGRCKFCDTEILTT